jgi:5-methyltetrahydrofolate--homocysteine methyltransferase
MQTKVSRESSEVVIGDEAFTVLIGERLNPTGRKKLSEALEEHNLDLVRQEAIAQVQAGADILDVNVGVTGVDEISLMVEVVHLVMATVQVPLCIDSNDPKTLEAALRIYKGKPLVNSVNGEERSLKEILPLVKQYGAAVIGLPGDEKGIPTDTERRLAITHKILERAEVMGISRENVIIDCLAMTVGADGKAGSVVLETIHKIKREFGVNLTLGASNISFGLPDRALINSTFLAMVIAAGVNCPIVDAAKVLPVVRASDLILGRDKYARRYTKSYRERVSQQ